MKKNVYSIVIVQAVVVITAFVLIAFIKKGFVHQHSFAVVSCVLNDNSGTAVSLMKAAALMQSGNNYDESRFETEDIIMQIVYQLARRSIVKVTVKDSAGSGIIWKTDDEIIIVSNKHLLMKDVTADITFGNGESITADVIGYSQQYDIGFVKISHKSVTNSVLRDIYEAVPVLYEIETETARSDFGQNYSGKNVLQVGAVIDRSIPNFSKGTINGLNFMPLFNTFVLETNCYSKAGMSGGGVFDEGGRLIGMISGGEVPETATVREAEITYSIPPILIEKEFEEIKNKAGV